MPDLRGGGGGGGDGGGCGVSSGEDSQYSQSILGSDVASSMELFSQNSSSQSQLSYGHGMPDRLLWDGQPGYVGRLVPRLLVCK